MTLAEAVPAPNLRSDRAHALDRNLPICNPAVLPFPRHHDLGQGATEIVTAWGRGYFFLALRFAFFAVFFLAAFFLAAMCFPLRCADSFRSAQ